MLPRRARTSSTSTSTHSTHTSRSGSILDARSRITKPTGSRENGRTSTSSIRGTCLEGLLESSQTESTNSSLSAGTRTNVSQRVMGGLPLPSDIANPVLGLMKNTLKGLIVDMTQLPSEVTQGLSFDVTRAFLSPADWKVFLEVSGRVSRFGNCSSLSCAAASTAIDPRASSSREHTALE